MPENDDDYWQTFDYNEFEDSDSSVDNTNLICVFDRWKSRHKSYNIKLATLEDDSTYDEDDDGAGGVGGGEVVVVLWWCW